VPWWLLQGPCSRFEVPCVGHSAVDSCVRDATARPPAMFSSVCSIGKPSATAAAGSGDAAGAAAAPAAKRLKTTGQVHHPCCVGMWLEQGLRGWAGNCGPASLSSLPAVAGRTGCCMFCTDRQCGVTAGLMLPSGSCCKLQETTLDHN